MAPSPPEIEILPARNKYGPFFILDTGEDVTACDVPTLGNQHPELFFPCHDHCVKILELVADARSQRDEAVRHVYGVLKEQWTRYIKKNGAMRPATNLMNAGRYGKLWQYQELVWRGGEETEVSLRSS